MDTMDSSDQEPQLRLRRLGIDAHQEPIIYLREDCPLCRTEGFSSHSRVQVRAGNRSIVATINIIRSDLINPGDAGLSESAWHRLGAEEGELVQLSHPRSLASLHSVRSKIYGNHLSELEMKSIIQDIADGRYADIYLAAFVTACTGDGLDLSEIGYLTRAMISVGEQLQWDQELIVDKHCVGGLPGNRTTLIIVPIVTSLGLTMPKTSSRSITSPAGTADTMETLAPVDLSLKQIQSVVQQEHGCIVWGGAVSLSPADEVFIRVERVLNLDTHGQLVASVLSKKAAAGSSHVLIDIPTGPTAKVRSHEQAKALAEMLKRVGADLGMKVRTAITEGQQPVGNGIGPALEARDVLSVLQGSPDAPADLREHAVFLAGEILEMSGHAEEGKGYPLASQILASGQAWKKFQAICEAQGGMRTPPVSKQQYEILAPAPGVITEFDNRRIAQTAKLAGAPMAAAAGIDLHVHLGMHIDKGAPLFTLHSETPGELNYALEYFSAHRDMIRIGSDP